jgi:LuxR family transcriptional regulator, maltose regulon positive regulatory protein
MRRVVTKHGLAHLAADPGRAPDPGLAPQRRGLARNPWDLVNLIERAARRRVTLVRGPTGSGKTLACSLWATRQVNSHVIWLTLSADDDQALFWAGIYSGLLRSSACPAEVLHALADVSAAEFPFRLAEVARLFTKPVVIVVDNAHDATSESLLNGLDLLVRNAPPTLPIVLAGRQTPELPRLARLEAAGDITIVDLADLTASPSRVPSAEIALT